MRTRDVWRNYNRLPRLNLVERLAILEKAIGTLADEPGMTMPQVLCNEKELKKQKAHNQKNSPKGGKRTMTSRYSIVREKDSTVKDLVERLKNFPQDSPVVAYNGDSQQMESITGILLRQDGVVEICTDEP